MRASLDIRILAQLCAIPSTRGGISARTIRERLPDLESKQDVANALRRLERRHLIEPLRLQLYQATEAGRQAYEHHVRTRPVRRALEDDPRVHLVEEIAPERWSCLSGAWTTDTRDGVWWTYQRGELAIHSATIALATRRKCGETWDQVCRRLESALAAVPAVLS